jgi:hypothetical protein
MAEASLLELLTKSAELETLAKKMEERGGELGARVAKRIKAGMEKDRKNGRRKFHRIKRLKSGNKRFAIKGRGATAQLPEQGFQADFTDVFKD